MAVTFGRTGDDGRVRRLDYTRRNKNQEHFYYDLSTYNGESTLQDLSGNGHDMTATGTISYVNGGLGKLSYYNSASDSNYFEVDTGIIGGSFDPTSTTKPYDQDFTYSVWARMDGLQQYQILLHNGLYSSGVDQSVLFRMLVSSEFNITSQIYVGRTNIGGVVTNEPGYGVWSNWVMRRRVSPARMDFFINNVLDRTSTSSAAASTIIGDSSTMHIGKGVSATGQFWNGDIGIAHGWYRYLSDEEITAEYNLFRTRFGV